ncbi:MAG TPA: hypothetical protein VFX60_05150, partial [Micromonospora sp.]|nr:hypothetical protein [Micromonospora sp.]
MLTSIARRPGLLPVAIVAFVLVVAGCDSAGKPNDGAMRRWVPAQEPVSPTPSTPPPFEGWSDPAKVGQPYGDQVTGLLTFRGNTTRTYYGTGPVPRTTPTQRWRYPRSGGLCRESTDGRDTRVWCGSGWTGQPAVFERDGRTWVVFGAYDGALHFLDAQTGERLLPSFQTGDIIKGSV